MIEGGWEYIMSAYGIVWVTLSIYGLSLYGRLRAHQRLEKTSQPWQ